MTNPLYVALQRFFIGNTQSMKWAYQGEQVSDQPAQKIKKKKGKQNNKSKVKQKKSDQKATGNPSYQLNLVKSKDLASFNLEGEDYRVKTIKLIVPSEYKDDVAYRLEVSATDSSDANHWLHIAYNKEGKVETMTLRGKGKSKEIEGEKTKRKLTSQFSGSVSGAMSPVFQKINKEKNKLKDLYIKSIAAACEAPDTATFIESHMTKASALLRDLTKYVFNPIGYDEESKRLAQVLSPQVDFKKNHNFLEESIFKAILFQIEAVNNFYLQTKARASEEATSNRRGAYPSYRISKERFQELYLLPYQTIIMDDFDSENTIKSLEKLLGKYNTAQDNIDPELLHKAATVPN